MENPGHPPRRLAVILHADVAGSTALVQRDEAIAHQRITDAFNELSRAVQNYGGTAHEIRGDALLAEFTRASDAVCAILAFQRANEARNQAFADDMAPNVRAGIALGEAIFADNTVTGTGVVLAQRIEQLALPGGVCITEAIREAMPTRLPFEFIELGEQELKGLEHPVRVHTVRLQQGSETPLPERTQPKGHRRRSLISLAALTLIAVGAAFVWLQPWQSREPDRGASRLPDKPSIAVLPFANLSGDPGQEYFSDGITRTIITALSKLSGLYVIASTSSFAYKGQQVRLAEIGGALGARYVVEGSVQKAGKRVRISAQLADVDTGVHLWAERYDRELEDIFALQDDVTAQVVSALSIELTEQERKQLARRYTKSFAAYDYFLKAQMQILRQTKEGNEQAREYLSRATELDPQFARAYSGLALTHVEDYRFRWTADRPAELAVELAQKAVELDDSLPQPHWVLGYVYLYARKRHDLAIAEAKKTLERDPNHADGLAVQAVTHMYIGEAEEAIRLIRKAMRINPHYPSQYPSVLGQAYYVAGRLDDAAVALEEAIERNYSRIQPHVLLAATYARMDRLEDAQWQADDVRTLDPAFLVDDWVGAQPFSDVLVERIAADLRKAGLD